MVRTIREANKSDRRGEGRQAPVGSCQHVRPSDNSSNDTCILVAIENLPNCGSYVARVDIYQGGYRQSVLNCPTWQVTRVKLAQGYVDAEI
jgi:hypothetical protein